METCFFIPPKGWEIANPEALAPRVHICFLGKSSKGLVPSINLATEPVDISLDSYIEEVRKIHSADPNSRWRDLGKYKSLLGDGRLTELETPTEQGLARIVQLVVIKDKVAYILTAGAIKEEFSKYYKTFDQVLRSLQSSSNLIESYSVKSNQLILKDLATTLIHKFHDLLGDKKIYTTRLSLMNAHSLRQPILTGIIFPGRPYALQISFVSRAVNEHDLMTAFNSDAFQKEFWKPFEKRIINDFTEMGPYWQILLLKEVQSNILNLRSE